MTEQAQLNHAVADLEFTATSGLTAKLADYKGKNIVLYFYPKDSTPGCTIESKGFAAQTANFAASNTVIFGISRDGMRSHENFKAKHNMPFELISDKDETFCRYFDVIKQKSMFGKKYMGIERSTFLIDDAGVLRKEWRKVKIRGHVDDVLQSTATITV
tara:strand:- start:312 stop:788 length:477 start_codon:yes stop_codon:yes gene_type:complete